MAQKMAAAEKRRPHAALHDTAALLRHPTFDRRENAGPLLRVRCCFRPLFGARVAFTVCATFYDQYAPISPVRSGAP